MDSTLVNEILKRLDAIGQKLSLAGSALYQALARGVLLNGIFDSIWALLWIGVGIAALRCGRWCWSHGADRYGEDGWRVLAVLLFILTAAMIPVALSEVLTSVSEFCNPNYYVFYQLKGIL